MELNLKNSIKVLVFSLLTNVAFIPYMYGQDIHFSQFPSSPLIVNPANTGQFEGAYRFAGNARRQWRSVTIPYQTYGGSIDASNFLKLKSLGTGISVYNDRTGDSRYNTFLANLSLSYSIPLTKDNKFYMTIGAQSGITQVTIDYSNLRYDNQYNGEKYDPNISSNENFGNTGRINMNLNTGILFTKKFQDRNVVATGFCLNNINKPNQSFYSNNTIGLDQRWTGHANATIMLSKKVDLVPGFLFMSQGKYKEYTAGTSVKFILKNKEQYRAIYIGAWSRIVDAAIVNIGLDYNSLYTGLSYDINYSSLTPASNGRGAIELSVIYIIKDVMPKRKKYKICPTFI